MPGFWALGAWVLGHLGSGPSSSPSLGLVKAEELPLTLSSGFLATLVQLCISNEASPAWGQQEWSGEVELAFGGQLTTTITGLFSTCPTGLPFSPPYSSNGRLVGSGEGVGGVSSAARVCDLRCPQLTRGDSLFHFPGGGAGERSFPGPELAS